MRHALPAPTLMLAAVFASALALMLTGCGATTQHTDSSGSACRAQWRDLSQSISSHTEEPQSGAQPSMLLDRWNSVAAGVQYYVTSANPADCGNTLAKQRLSINALIDFENGLQRFDMQYQLDQLTGPATAYLEATLPTAPQGHKAKGAKAKPVPKKAVREALQVLHAEAATASSDMSTAWNQANTVDLSDRSAVEQALSDLTYLGNSSAAYRQCAAATTTINQAIEQLIRQSSGN